MHPLIVFNGRFNDFTVNCNKIKALLIDRNEIQKIYYNTQNLPLPIKKLDLNGKYVLPGFTDCHTHLISRGLELQRIDLTGGKSLDSCLQKITGEKHKHDIVFAQNYDDSDWSGDEKERLNRRTLDRITKKPLIMRRVCGHCAVVNTSALKCIPRGWHYIQSNTGRLCENAALFLNDIFKPDQATLLKAIGLGMQEAAKNGVTTVHEISDPQRIELLLKFKRCSGLKTRFVLYIYEQHASTMFNAGLVNSWGDDFIRFAGIKIFLDGSIGARTAALKQPYVKCRNRGKVLLTQVPLKNLIKKAEKNGTQLMIHAIGDRAIDFGLKVLKPYIDKKNSCRHRLEHLELLNQRLIERLARMNIIASMQPNFVRRWQNPGGLYEKTLGHRFIDMNPFKSLARAGIHLVFGSDCMPIGPLFGLKGATDHPSAKNRLSLMQALACYTVKPAYAAFEEHHKGDFKPGKFADFVILDQDPEKIDDTDKLNISMVMLGGEIIYRNPA
ncbi:hypothetical protein A2Y85_02435 [candidate division WOR-3 bacterium RBG_13_43_14]|uniref:Amidohydrolase 3 domain-containing protein n=1 Tax=candidate division WOR-3 bacterium RBG_13_43_14 TaxID=1802590 RepID=A0A1F4UCR2_UNCW3|nr:MAG: hypothetical protein A2Y85_02435 [candidate division WOR-3 bacterium RBG_13_43_14]